MSDWIPTEWRRASDTARHDNGVSITRMTSPFYPDVRYAVRWGSNVLSVDGKWEYEPMPSSRDEAFYGRFRFPTFEAATAALAALGDNGQPDAGGRGT